MKNFSNWKEYEGTSEGSGRSEKIWLQNPDNGKTGLFKFKKDLETTDHISEKYLLEKCKMLEALYMEKGFMPLISLKKNRLCI